MNVFRVGESVEFTTPHRCRADLWGRTGINRRSRSSTFYGYVIESCNCYIEGLGIIRLSPGSYFAARHCFTAFGEGGTERPMGLLIEMMDHDRQSMLGGPIEDVGRLKYIDGCSDSLLISPMVIGEPCLNHLHFPKGIDQTAHTHPSVRIGVVTGGSGWCRTPDERYPLAPGFGWYLPVDDVHAFETTDDTLDVIAWHPDSDTGPTHDDHPMLNRTIVDGVSAAQRPEIRTQELRQ